MFKKIGMSMLLAFTLLALMYSVGRVTSVYATAPCTTLEECRELQRSTRDSIAEIMEEEEEVSDYIAELHDEISGLRDEIDGIEDRINGLVFEVDDLADDIAGLADATELNLEILRGIEGRIAILLDEISQRMRIVQRVNNTNSFLAVISEAENLADFVRRARTFYRFATEDTEALDELVQLIESQENLLRELEEQRDQFQQQTSRFETLRNELLEEQENLEEDQIALIERETEMQDRLYEINITLVDEEELLGAIVAAEAILAHTPPPATMTSSNAVSLAQTPNSSGLAHPMPGSRVTSEFGPRGGRHHSGIDLAFVGNQSAPILSSAAGTVTINQWHNSLGWYMVISHNINGQRVDTLYAHLRYQSAVRVGSIVAQGDRIGTKGNTGNSSGAHLHFEVHPGGWAWGNSVNPRRWINF